jgi:hypothetical protein
MARQKKTHDPFRWFDSSPEAEAFEKVGAAISPTS